MTMMLCRLFSIFPLGVSTADCIASISMSVHTFGSINYSAWHIKSIDLKRAWKQSTVVKVGAHCTLYRAKLMERPTSLLEMHLHTIWLSGCLTVLT